LAYDGSALYLNGFYANQLSALSLAVIYSGAAVNFATKAFTGAGEYVQSTLQKPTIISILEGGVVVQLAAATQSMLVIAITLKVSKWNGVSWDPGVSIGGNSCTFVTGTDTASAYPYKTPFTVPYTIPSFTPGTLYRVYPDVSVSCYRLTGALFANMANVWMDATTHIAELKI